VFKATPLTPPSEGLNRTVLVRTVQLGDVFSKIPQNNNVGTGVEIRHKKVLICQKFGNIPENSGAYFSTSSFAIILISESDRINKSDFVFFNHKKNVFTSKYRKGLHVRLDVV